MTLAIKDKSNPQWRYERPHRVRLFRQSLHFHDAYKLNARQIYMHCAEHFSKTDQYRWVEENNIKIDYMSDDLVTSWHKTVIFYADLSESEYIDYALRFFKHKEEWK